MVADLRNLQNPMQDSVETALEAREIGGGADRRPLVDPFGRAISYLRVSVTDRCDFRCVYCMAENMSFLPKAEILTLEELDRLCSAFIARGVRKLRLTGGEPLVRRGIMTLVNSLSRHLRSGQLDELTVTTNGSQLEKYAGDLRAAGIRRINVSLDTLDAEKFRAITRWGSLDKVLAGIDVAQSAGLKIKINAVALKNVNEDEFPQLLEWAHGRGMDLTLIEVMPLGEIGEGALEQRGVGPDDRARGKDLQGELSGRRFRREMNFDGIEDGSQRNRRDRRPDFPGPAVPMSDRSI